MVTPVHHSVTQGTLDFAMECISTELEKMLCIAISLANKLEPNDVNNPQNGEDVVAWRLAQVLEDRLSDTAFEHSLRRLLHVQNPAIHASGGEC